MGNQQVVTGLLAGVEVGVEHVMRFCFAGVNLGGIPVGADGLKDCREACAFMCSEINVERDEVGHSPPPGVMDGVMQLTGSCTNMEIADGRLMLHKNQSLNHLPEYIQDLDLWGELMRCDGFRSRQWSEVSNVTPWNVLQLNRLAGPECGAC